LNGKKEPGAKRRFYSLVSDRLKNRSKGEEKGEKPEKGGNAMSCGIPKSTTQ